MNEDLRDITMVMSKWTMQYCRGVDFEKHDEDIQHTVVYAAIHSKMAMAGMKIIVPDAFIILLIILTDANPGQSILLFREVLESIMKRSGHKVKPGYLIQPMDVGYTWASGWPFMKDPEIDKKYHKLWLAQKMPRTGFTDNRCDTPEWWREVYEE